MRRWLGAVAPFVGLWLGIFLMLWGLMEMTGGGR